MSISEIIIEEAEKGKQKKRGQQNSQNIKGKSFQNFQIGKGMKRSTRTASRAVKTGKMIKRTGRIKNGSPRSLISEKINKKKKEQDE